MGCTAMSRQSKLRTLQDVVAALPRLSGRRAVMVHRDLGASWWSYERLHREVGRVAAGLRDRGVGRGDRVLLWAPNSPEWVAVLFGAAMRGAVVILVDADASAEAVARIAADHGCRVVFGHRDAPEMTARNCCWIVIASLEAIGRDDPPDASRIAVGEDDPVVLLFSSGTTSSPKGVLLSHRNVMCQIDPFVGWRAVVTRLPIRMLVLPPASHVLGLVVGLVLPLSLGLTIVYTAGTHAPTWARVIRDYRVVFALTVPRVLQVLERTVRSTPFGRLRQSLDERLQQSGRWGKIWWPIWARGEIFGRPFFRMFLVGGAHLPPATTRFWRRTGVLVIQGYGLAETSAIVSLSNPFSTRVGHVGRPRRFRAIELAKDGEILVSGPHVALSSCGEQRRDHDRLATGDLGTFDRRGRLTILGRKKDVIVTAEGFNVHPDVVEAEVVRQEGVIDAAVVARTGHEGEEVHAVLRLAASTDATSVVQRANARLDEHQRVRGWTVWPRDEEIPRNLMGKVLRGEVLARLQALWAGQAGSLAIGGGCATLAITIADLQSEPDRRHRIRLVAQYALQDSVVDDGNCRLGDDLGLSSLDVVEVLALLEGGDSAAHSVPFIRPGATVGELRAQVARGTDASTSQVPAGASWSTLPWRIVQPLTRASIIATWAALNARVESTWEIDPTLIHGPLFLAVAPHRHWLDSFVMHRALPRHLRRHLHLLIEHDFSEHFRPQPDTLLRSRSRAAFAYYVGLPALFTFTVLQPHGRTREGLLDAARRIDRGRVLLSFPKGLAFYGNPRPDYHALGIARLAIETGRPILPVHLETQAVSFDWRWRRPRQRIRARFGVPIAAPVDGSAAQLASDVEAAFNRLRDQAAASTS
jgi:long-chain acyl-CoA synthetase